MARILCIDYGKKRCGIAVTDPLKIIATPLTTVETSAVINFLKKYIADEEVELFLVGQPTNLDGSVTHATIPVQFFIEKLKKEFSTIPLQTIDEQYTSKNAARSMHDMGMKKKDRRKKENLDQLAAALMLQEHLRTLG